MRFLAQPEAKVVKGGASGQSAGRHVGLQLVQGGGVVRAGSPHRERHLVEVEHGGGRSAYSIDVVDARVRAGKQAAAGAGLQGGHGRQRRQGPKGGQRARAVRRELLLLVILVF